MLYHLFAYILTLVSNAEATEKPWENSYRLPQTSIPLTYEIYLHPDMEKQTFTGKVSIQIQNTVEKDHLYLHVKSLHIMKSQVYKGYVPLGKEENATKVPISRQFPYLENDFWVSVFSENLGVDVYSWHLEFCGELPYGEQGWGAGLYWDSYTNDKGEIR